MTVQTAVLVACVLAMFGLYVRKARTADDAERRERRARVEADAQRRRADQTAERLNALLREQREAERHAIAARPISGVCTICGRDLTWVGMAGQWLDDRDLPACTPGGDRHNVRVEVPA